MSLPPVSVVQIHIHNLYSNTVLNSGHGGRVTLRNSVHNRMSIVETRPDTPHSAPQSSRVTERRVEAQPRIRRTLEDVSTQPEYASSRIGLVAFLATGILSVVKVQLPLVIESWI